MSSETAIPGVAIPVVAILVTPESAASVVYGMYDLFKCAGRDWPMVAGGPPGAPLLDPVIVSRAAGIVRAANGVPIEAHRSLHEMPAPTVVCVPELLISPNGSLDGLFDAEAAWVRQSHATGALLATACSGAMLLGEAGLLDGEDATTHWAFCDAMQRRYPLARVRPQRALVAAGDGQRLVMAGGGSSWMDLALYLIARLAGIEAAMQVAKLNLIDWHHVGQQPFARVACARQVDDAVIGRCQAWIADHYTHPAPVAAMTEHSGLAERSFQRRFKLATGMTPMEYIQTLRIEEAKHLLETTADPVEAVAGEVGYDDAAFFSRLFRRSVNLSPAQYRRRFSGLRAVLAEPGTALNRSA
ncbi:helix-turn-helix domain-containing protein [Variovorax sp. J22R133]|uniref:GlxA family transcriptional regulator n=1 Tax=Variovorax brevis TaxID=3053503 RepID=UPI002575931D|nr:helix-turn-helix domain-containing protein [Variovorax sp. J22R133]MDM0115397.1 helix-turn-helix domain-containing protein [Variovorax sp. J22R133]